MTCASCVHTIERALNMLPGVKKATISLLTESALIHYTDEVGPEDLVEAIEDVGFEAQVNETVSDKSTLNLTLSILDMDATDATGIESFLSNMKGVLKAAVNPTTDLLFVELDPDLASPRCV